jgi:hypothetical protein
VNAPRPPSDSSARIAREAREQFVVHARAALVPMGQALRARFSELLETSPSTRDMQERRDAMMDFDRKAPRWLDGVAKAWQGACVPPTATARIRLESTSLTLVGEDVVERKILSSRLALAIQEKAAWELNDLRVRMQFLEGGDDLASTDIFRPEALSQLLVEQWSVAELSAESWALVQDVIQRHIVEHVAPAYKAANEFLIGKGVLRDIDLSSRVKRTSSPGDSKRSAGNAQPEPADSEPSSETGGFDSGTRSQPGSTGFSRGDTDGGGYSGQSGQGQGAQGRYADSAGGQGGQGGQRGQGGQGQGGQGGQGGPRGQGGQGGHFGQGGQGQRGQGGQGYADTGAGDQGDQGGQAWHGGSRGGGAGGGDAGDASGQRGAGGRYGAGSGGVQQAGAAAGSRGGAHDGGHHGVHDETRLMTSSPPLARARARASGVLGQLKRLLSERVVGFDGPPATRPSPALAEALSHEVTQVQATAHGSGTVQDSNMVYDDAAVQDVAVDLRRRTGELKKKAATSTEKATIEIVALMFQSILSEERIPPAIRVWFARLQMPVLRVAIAEPEFFGSLEHPARQLIDRMGSCVMGFDAATIGGSALEIEIKRVVQVIEQYPETGRRVFQLVYDEFQKFLSKYLTDKSSTQRLVSVAQQVEQKETLAIQYTIEMRSMLADLPVRDEIREFLFKVWAEVLAVAAVKNGPQHEDTLALKACASELVWAASAKPNRGERARVIQDLPKLLQRLRQGMSLIGVQGKAQEGHIKSIGDTLADAFLSKTQAIPQSTIEAMSKRLAHLEDFVANDPATDLPLDAQSIELMLGIDASMIEVVADGGSRPNAAMLSWANELQLGNWFALDHNGAVTQVQYAWRSDRKQLHLFAAPGGRSYLIQARRLAAYLQAGLLLPAEEEALTVRATRDALAKLDANPERLLQ